MRIGFDISQMYVAIAGVLHYSVRLLQKLIEEGRQHDFVLLDYEPVHASKVCHADLGLFSAPHVRRVVPKGLRRRCLANWKGIDLPGWPAAARRVDALLQKPWDSYSRIQQWLSLNSALDAVDIFHSSDVLQFYKRKAVNIITVHDLTTDLFPQFHVHANLRLHQSKMSFVAQKADHIIAVSQNTKRDLMALYGVPEDRISVVYEAAAESFRPIHDPALLSEWTAAYGIAPQKYLLSVGTLEPRKNYSRLISAYQMLFRQNRHGGCKLVLGGTRGWLFEDLFRQVESSGLTGEVIFTNHLPEEHLPVLMNGASIFVYPSLYEGFGLPVLEAMACGVPVITSNVSSLPEVVGDAGLMVSPTDTGELAAAIAGLLESEHRRTQLGQMGLQRAAQFSWARAARETLAVYEKTLSAVR